MDISNKVIATVFKGQYVDIKAGVGNNFEIYRHCKIVGYTKILGAYGIVVDHEDGWWMFNFNKNVLFTSEPSTTRFLIVGSEYPIHGNIIYPARPEMLGFGKLKKTITDVCEVIALHMKKTKGNMRKEKCKFSGEIASVSNFDILNRKANCPICHKKIKICFTKDKLKALARFVTHTKSTTSQHLHNSNCKHD